MAIVTAVANIVLDIISALGYPGIFFLMTLESMCFPIPSEAVVTFAGTLVGMGGSLSIMGDPLLGVLAVTIVSTLGCTFGSVIAYYIGLKGGRPFILRYGRYVLLNENHLDYTEKWFCKYGNWAVFGSRLLPVVRTFISLPAGMAKMDFKNFVILSTIGSFIWCLALAYLGLILGQHWDVVMDFFGQLDILIVVAAVIVLVWFIFQRRKSGKKHTDEVCDQE